MQSSIHGPHGLRWQLLVLVSRWRNRLRYLMTARRVFRNWWAWPLPKLGVSVVLELRNGLRYFVRSGTGDLGVLNETVMLNPYLGGGHIKLRKDATVIDIGANIGDFAIQVAALCPLGQVFAVEPISEYIQMISINKMLNGLPNIELIHSALGSYEGEIEIHLAGSHSSAYFRTKTDSMAERVRVLTLPQLMREHGIDQVDLLKLDCEGAEWEILPCCTEIFPQIRQICMEFHPGLGWTAEKLVSWLRNNGYEVAYTKGDWNGCLWATRSGPSSCA